MFNKRIWLGSKNNAGTGNAVAFAGKRVWHGKEYKDLFLSIADCSVSVRLHMMQGDTKKDFIKKLKRLRRLVNEFINYLEA